MKNIRSKYVKDSLLDYASLTKSLKENTTDAVRDLLGEAVRDTYNKILSESEDDYDEEEMEDTDSENNFDDTESDGSSTEETQTEVTPDGAVQKTTQGSDGEGNEWSEFEKYKVSDDQYDFSNAEDEEIVRAYKLMKDEDQLIVTKDGDKIHLQDNETGADYIIDLQSVPSEQEGDDDTLVDDTEEKVTTDTDDFGDDDIDMTDEASSNTVEDTEDDGDSESYNGLDFKDYPDDFDSDDDTDEDSWDDEDGGFGDDDSDEDDYDDENEDDKNMNEQRIFEIALNEYDSNVGYTDNYQKKDVMTNQGMSEPAKSSSTNDWDKGIPHGTEKPWSGKNGGKKENQPFHGEKGTTIEEEFDECGDMFEEEDGDYGTVDETSFGGELNELKTNAEHAANNGSTSRTDGPNNPRRRKARSFHTAQNGQETGTATNAYAPTNESIRMKANQIFKENQQLKKILNDFRTTLNEAAVTNVNLGKIIKLISENTTTSDEKREIISRFGKEAKTIGASNALYESISNELKKKGKMNINEDKQFTANSSKMINETEIYKSKDLMESLGLMHKICKL